MTAIVLPDIDRSTIEDLRKKMPNLSEIELPSMKQVGKNADETIDRLLGRKRAPVWPWVAAGIGLVAVIGMVAAYLTWFRRPAWETDTTSDAWTTTEPTDSGASTGNDATSDPSTRTGLTASESSLSSTGYPTEEA